MSAIVFTVDTQPLPKQRPRVVNGRAHTPTKTRDYEELVAWHARLAMGERPPLAGSVIVLLEFVRDDRRRADLDNMIKAVLDAINGVCYQDDWQIVGLTAKVERGADVAGVRVEVSEA